jgi:hypothetical protein
VCRSAMSLCRCVSRLTASPPSPLTSVAPCRPSDFAVHVASRGAVGASRQHHVRSHAPHLCTPLSYSEQVFVNRAVADSRPTTRSTSLSTAASSSSAAAAPPPGCTLPRAPFGILVSDTQSTVDSLETPSQPGRARGRGNIAQLQAADDRYRCVTDGTPTPSCLLCAVAAAAASAALFTRAA